MYAILCAILLPTLSGYIDGSKQKELVSTCRACVQAAQVLSDEFYAKNGYVSGHYLTDAAVKSNKVNWQVVGYPNGEVQQFTTTVRYAAGATCVYNGNNYVRTDYNPTGAQTPKVDPPQNSKY